MVPGWIPFPCTTTRTLPDSKSDSAFNFLEPTQSPPRLQSSHLKQGPHHVHTSAVTRRAELGAFLPSPGLLFPLGHGCVHPSQHRPFHWGHLGEKEAPAHQLILPTCQCSHQRMDLFLDASVSCIPVLYTVILLCFLFFFTTLVFFSS